MEKLELKIEELEQALQLAFFCPTTEDMGTVSKEPVTWGPTTLLLGDPAIGKTMTVRKVAKQFDLPLVTLQASLLRDDQLTAIPLPDGKGGYKFVPFLPQIAELAEKQAGVLFVDDLSLATENVMKPLMTLFHERRINEIELGPRVRLVAAANRAEDVGSESGLFSAFSSRVTQLCIESPKQRTYIDYSKKLVGALAKGEKSKKKKMEYEKEEGTLFHSQEQYIMENWMDVYPDVCESIHAFMKSTKMPAHEKPGQNEDKSKPWVSSRSLDAAKRWITAGRILNISPNIIGNFVIGCIGEKYGVSLWKALSDKDIPTPSDVLSGKWEPDVTRTDRTILVIEGVTQYVLEEEENNEVLEAKVSLATELILRFINKGLGETVINLYKAINGMRPRDSWSPTISSNMKTILKEFAMNENLTAAIKAQ